MYILEFYGRLDCTELSKKLLIQYVHLTVSMALRGSP